MNKTAAQRLLTRPAPVLGAGGTGAIKEKGTIEDVFQGKTIVAEYKKEIDAVELFSAEGGSASGGEKKLERINPFGAFWFSWAAAHPGTDLYK